MTALHRRLLAGKAGRILVEITTCWTIITVILGIALWWPKRMTRIPGNWLPRIGGSLKRQVRDWHAVTGAWFTLFALIFMVTGLFFSPVWGRHIGRHLMVANNVFYQDFHRLISPATSHPGHGSPSTRPCGRRKPDSSSAVTTSSFQCPDSGRSRTASPRIGRIPSTPAPGSSSMPGPARYL